MAKESTHHPNVFSNTYTRNRAMELLGIKSRSAFHHLRRQYPKAFVIVRQGYGREGTLYNKTALDKFIEWRSLHFQFEPDDSFGSLDPEMPDYPNPPAKGATLFLKKPRKAHHANPS